MRGTKTKHSTVVGVFHDRADADRAVAELRRAGFHDDQIGFIMQNRGGESQTTAGTEDHTGEGAAIGAGAGVVIGGLTGAVLAGLIPGVGPVIAAGILAATVGGGAIGAAAGGILGALIGMGVPEEEAHYYEQEFRSGRILVTVKANSRHDEAWSILHRFGAYNRASAGTARAATTSSTTHAGVSPDATTIAAGRKGTMKVHEEELHAHKQPVETGQVSVRKEVVTEHKTVEVPVKREEVVVERHPVGEQMASSSDIRPGEELRIPVHEEQVRVEKTPVVKEEVTVGKKRVQGTKRVGGTVRKEEVRVEKQGDVDVTSKSKGRGRSPRKRS